LLTYSIYQLYKEKKSLLYKPFLMGVSGALLIITDNFILGETMNLHNVPSWIGNGLLIGGAIWAGRDRSKEATSPFGF